MAGTLNDWCGVEECQFIVDTGDNFYSAGVTSVDDPRFETSWRSVYDLPNIASKQWFISIGNHDHGQDIIPDGREWFQVSHFYIDIIQSCVVSYLRGLQKVCLLYNPLTDEIFGKF